MATSLLWLGNGYSPLLILTSTTSNSKITDHDNSRQYLFPTDYSSQSRSIYAGLYQLEDERREVVSKTF